MGVTLLRQLAAEAAEIFEHAAARPVGIGAIFENHIDERKAVERIAAHHFRVRHRKHFGRDRIGDLVLHDLRRLARPFRVDDDLRVREIGNGIERNVAQRKDPAKHQRKRRQQNDELVLAARNR